MSIFVRLLVGIPLAAVIAMLLFLVMRALIAIGDVNLDEERELVRIDIRPQVEEILAQTRDMTPDQVRDVDPPPPPPEVRKQASALPTEAMVNIGGQIPEFEQPDLSRGDISFNVSDRDAQPMVRIPPTYPPRAAEQGVEGNCVMNFDVSPDGQPFNIRAASCTSAQFESTSMRAVERWRYQPKIVDGVPVARTGVVTVIEYQLEG
jgi:protein TonB